jgi:hypothetical protein
MAAHDSAEEASLPSGLPAWATWGKFPETPERGTANYAQPAHVTRAARLVRTGEVVGLDYPLNAFMPSLAPRRGAPTHRLISRHRDHRDDYLDGFWPQAATHIDGLRHRRHAQFGFYNGVADDDIEAGTPTLGVNRWSETPIVGRGVLLDSSNESSHHFARDRRFWGVVGSAILPTGHPVLTSGRVKGGEAIT